MATAMLFIIDLFMPYYADTTSGDGVSQVLVYLPSIRSASFGNRHQDDPPAPAMNSLRRIATSRRAAAYRGPPRIWWRIPESNSARDLFLFSCNWVPESSCGQTSESRQAL